MASGSVFLNNLDDFITPSQACVNPYVTGKITDDSTMETSSSSAPSSSSSSHLVTNHRSNKKHRITLEPDDTDPFTDFGKLDIDTVLAEPNLIHKRVTSDAKTVASVSLNDCLACSGCVTSAETVLIQEQSSQKLVQLLEEQNPDITIVVQISPNSRASIAQFLGIPKHELFLKLATIFKSHGVKYVLDAACGADVAIHESREEFIHRFMHGKRTPQWVKPVSSTAVSSTSVAIYPTGRNNHTSSAISETRSLGWPTLSPTLPVLTSHCPGWVCYAEKTSPQAIPYLSTVKSPQQIVGSVIKSILTTDSSEMEDMIEFLDRLDLQNISLDNKNTHPKAVISANGKKKQRVFVVSIQPCYDKKLEASRKDFFHSQTGIQEVDLVLSTTELWQLLESYAWKWNLERQREAWMECDDPSTPTMEVSDETSHAPPTESNISQHQQTLRCPQFTPLSPNSNGLPPNLFPINGNTVSTFMDMEAAGIDLDHEDFLLNHITPKRSRSSTTEENTQQNERKALIKSAFGHVYEYLDTIEMDSIIGQDNIERMFRCFSSDGLYLLSATEINRASGGYAEYIFKYVADKLYGIDLYDLQLPYREGRNPDIAEIDLKTIIETLPDDIKPSAHQPPVYTVDRHNLKMGKAYGFRNIQSILVKMKKGQFDLDLVEVMACPSGCNNGGGQLKSLSSILPLSSAVSNPVPPRPEAPLESRDRINLVEKIYHENLRFQHPDNNPLVQYLYRQDRLIHPLSEESRAILHTRYHAVPSLETIAPLAAKW